MTKNAGGWTFLPAFLLLACLISAAWGMKAFFVQPAGRTRGMKLITATGSAFALLHLAVILLARAVAGWMVALATGLYTLSLVVYWWAISINRAAPLSAAFSPDLPAHLVRRGPYRFVRHPFYCSYLMVWVAGPFASGKWWLSITTTIMMVIYVKAARSEERKFAASPLAGEYDRYRNTTGLLAPDPLKWLKGARKP